MSCVYVPVFTIRLDLALCLFCIGFVCLDFSLWICCLALSRLVLPSFCFVSSCRCQKHKAMLGYPVLWYSCSPQDPSCSPWEPWPLEASVGPKWFCGTGSSGNVFPSQFKPNGSEGWCVEGLSQTV